MRNVFQATPIVRSLWWRCGYALRFVRFLCQYVRFASRSRHEDDRFDVALRNVRPYLDDGSTLTPFDPHYVYLTGWACRILRRSSPPVHVDVGSSLAFVAAVSAFIPVKFYDYRPAPLDIEGVETGFADLQRLPFADKSIASISCMHVVEHIGLGRYGDALDPLGDVKAMSELDRVVARDGHLLLVVPVGSPCVCFNGHRIYAFDQVITAVPRLRLETFALVTDAARGGRLLNDATREEANRQEYGCGCFLFKRSS